MGSRLADNAFTWMMSRCTSYNVAHGQALPFGEVSGCTRPKHQGPVSNVAVSHQHFTGNPSPLVSGATWWDTSGASNDSFKRNATSGVRLTQALLCQAKLGVSCGVQVPVG